MTRSTFRGIALAVAVLAVAGSLRAADEQPRLPSVVPSPSGAFFNTYLAPRITARLKDQRAVVAVDVAGASSNPWTRDLDGEARVRREAIRATKSAVKRYAIERLNLASWSLPLLPGRASGASALRTESGGPRLRFGFSHLAPRAEVLFPAGGGRCTFAADALGRVGTSFESFRGTLKVGAALDPRERTATVGLTLAF